MARAQFENFSKMHQCDTTRRNDPLDLFAPPAVFNTNLRTNLPSIHLESYRTTRTNERNTRERVCHCRNEGTVEGQTLCVAVSFVLSFEAAERLAELLAHLEVTEVSVVLTSSY